LLYELLTGTTPLERETLRKAALDEIQRMIRETDPAKPSTRLSQELVAANSEVGTQNWIELPHVGSYRSRRRFVWCGAIWTGS
jgi:hypothetical protein